MTNFNDEFFTEYGEKYRCGVNFNFFFSFNCWRVDGRYYVFIFIVNEIIFKLRISILM